MTCQIILYRANVNQVHSCQGDPPSRTPLSIPCYCKGGWRQTRSMALSIALSIQSKSTMCRVSIRPGSASLRLLSMSLSKRSSYKHGRTHSSHGHTLLSLFGNRAVTSLRASLCVIRERRNACTSMWRKQTSGVSV